MCTHFDGGILRSFIKIRGRRECKKGTITRIPICHNIECLYEYSSKFKIMNELKIKHKRSNIYQTKFIQKSN